MDSCVSAKGEMNTSAKNPSQHFLLLPLSSPTFNFIHSATFLRQSSSLSSDFPFLMGTSNVVREVQESMLSSFDKCLNFLDKLRSQNGIVDKLMSLSSHLQKGCQIPRSNFRTVGMVSNSNFAAILPGDSVAGVVVGNGVMNFLNIYNTLLVVRLVLTWFPSAPPAIVSPLSTLCDPYLNIFRGIIPPLGGTLDLSPILAFLVLNAFTSAAAALPAELPSSKGVPSPSITSSQKKWMTRLSGNKSTSFTDPKL